MFLFVCLFVIERDEMQHEPFTPTINRSKNQTKDRIKKKKIMYFAYTCIFAPIIIINAHL
jgi:hypothetical protein